MLHVNYGETAYFFELPTLQNICEQKVASVSIIFFMMNYADVPFHNHGKVLKVHVCELFGTHTDVVDTVLFFPLHEIQIFM